MPGSISHTGHIFTLRTRRTERYGNPAHRYHVARIDQPANLDLHSLQRGIHVPDGSARAGFLAENVPWLKRLPKFEMDVPGIHITNEWEAKFEMGSKPLRFHRVTAALKIFNNIAKIAPDKMRQHPTVMDLCSPVNQTPGVRLFPEPGDQGSEQQLLSETHPGVGGHLKGSHFEQTQPA